MANPHKAFHARQGWYFRREPDGSVRIFVDSLDGGIILDANTWASVVAHVCARGENFDTFTAAVAFHEELPQVEREVAG